MWLLATPVALQIPREMNSVVNAQRATASGVILIAGRDRVAPPRFQWEIANAYAGPKEVIELEEGCGHFGEIWHPSPWFDRVSALQAAFLLRHLAAGR